MADGITSFLGETSQYWFELRRRFEKEEGRDAPNLLREVVNLRGRIDFYESRIKDMASVASHKL